jgi:hypothetical protein
MARQSKCGAVAKGRLCSEVARPTIASRGTLRQQASLAVSAPLKLHVRVRMGSATQDSVKCSGCSYVLSPEHSGPCPRCGDTRKTHDVHIEETVRVSAALRWQHIREHYEKHHVLLPLVIGITVGSPFLGLLLAGWVGVGVGLLIGITTFILGLRAVTKVREIREGS